MTKREKKRTQDIHYRQRNSDLGLCISCPKKRLINSNKFCEKHYLMHMAYLNLGTTKLWESLKDLFVKQDGKCAYTGAELVFGYNASIDHRRPLSRFPELKNDLSNLQWVTKEINFFKNKFTEEQLLFFCEKIYFKLLSEGSNACGGSETMLQSKCLPTNQELSNLITIKI